MAKVLSINISDKKGIVKTPVSSAKFIEGFGVENDAHGGCDDIKQVSLLANESVNKMRQKGFTLNAGDFAENITTEGLELHTLPVGTRLKIGDTLQEVSRIGKECHAGCAIKQQTGSCIMPTEGIFTRVIEGGNVFCGDEIIIVKGE